MHLSRRLMGSLSPYWAGPSGTHSIRVRMVGSGKLSDLVKRFCPHIGQESFFELM